MYHGVQFTYGALDLYFNPTSPTDGEQKSSKYNTFG